MSSGLDRQRPEFYDDVMRFIEQLQAVETDEEQAEIVNAWIVWKSVNHVGQDDWGNLRFVVELQKVSLATCEQMLQSQNDMLNTYEEMFQTQERTISSCERIIAAHEQTLASYKNRLEKLGMYAGYLEEMFLGKPGPSSFPAS